MSRLEREDIRLLPLAAYGLAKGALKVYLQPSISNLASRAIERFFGPVDMEAIQQHIGEVLLEEMHSEIPVKHAEDYGEAA